MPTTRTLKKPTLDPQEVVETFTQWSTIKAQGEELAKRQTTLRQRLVDYLEQFGEPDDKGHLRLRLAKVVDGMGGLKYEKRVSRSLDEDVAEKILGKKGLLEQCQKTITVLDESEIETLMFQQKLTKAEYAKIFPAKETWAMKPEKD